MRGISWIFSVTRQCTVVKPGFSKGGGGKIIQCQSEGTNQTVVVFLPPVQCNVCYKGLQNYKGPSWFRPWCNL